MLFTAGCFSYLLHPREDYKITFIVGNESMIKRAVYEIGDMINDYDESEVFLGEYKVSKENWKLFWIAVRDGKIVGLDECEEGKNKFNTAKRCSLAK